MSKRAIILAGGLGTRLRPYTVAFPKPLMPIGKYPIMEIVIRQLAKNGFNHITIAVNHQAQLIQAYFGDGHQFGLTIDYSLEQEPLGTMGPLKLVADLPENFLVMNGDILTDLNYNTFYEDHVNSGSIFSISSFTRDVNIDFGVLEANNNGELIGFKEKPSLKYSVSMGIYMVKSSALHYIPGAGPYGFDDLMHQLLREGVRPRLAPHSGYWLDIGRPDDFQEAVEKFQEDQGTFLDV